MNYTIQNQILDIMRPNYYKCRSVIDAKKDAIVVIVDDEFAGDHERELALNKLRVLESDFRNDHDRWTDPRIKFDLLFLPNYS